MNKVIQANLAGIAFTLDEDAYRKLDDYLAKLDGYFRHSEGHSEIMHDVEARIAELFTTALKQRSIVTLDDVLEVIGTMGEPEDFGIGYEDEAESTTANHERAEKRDYGRSYTRYGKKLMRDPDDQKIGGVCAGLAAYLGIDDPLWLRIAFVAAVVFGGVGLLPYVILWILMPEAKTAGDKLAMRGEPINVNSISEQVEREARSIASKIQKWGDEVNSSGWGSKSRRNKRRHKHSDEEFMV